MIESDIVVIGAGPAGAEFAYRMAPRWRVVMLEKGDLLREKTCGGGIQTQEIVEFGELPDAVVERHISSARIHAPGGACLDVPQFHPARGATVKRALFDRYLQRRAEAEGASVLGHHEVTNIEAVADAMVVTALHQQQPVQLRCRLVVYAAGAGTTLLRNCGINARIRAERLYVAVEAWYEFPSGEVERRFGDCIELFGGNDVAIGGYGWIFPKKDVISVGLGTTKAMIAQHKVKLNQRLKYFTEQHPGVAPRLHGAQMLHRRSGLIPAEPLEQLAYPGIILIGDAGGFGNVLHGGGIYQARKSAQIAAEHVESYLNSGASEGLREYETAAKRHFHEYEHRWDEKMVQFFWKENLLDRAVHLASSSHPELVKGFSIILNSTQSHRDAYLIFEQAMLDILYDYMREEAAPYRAILEAGFAKLQFPAVGIEAAVKHILFADAKRFRATLVFWACQLFTPYYQRAVSAAVAYELLHTASLIHDDIGDNATQRRGKDCVHIQFGTDMAITAGDYLIFKACTLLQQADWSLSCRSQVLSAFLLSAQAVTEGQARDIHLSRRCHEWSQAAYTEMASLKTGALIEAPLCAGGVIAGADADELSQLQTLGRMLGLAFQIIDDSHDLLADDGRSSKNILTDLREGKCTVLTSHLYEVASEQEKQQIAEIFAGQPGDEGAHLELLELMRKHGSIHHAQHRCGELARQMISSLENLPLSPSREKLAAMADMILDWSMLSR